jgi:hypothetical protein
MVLVFQLVAPEERDGVLLLTDLSTQLISNSVKIPVSP